jgi:ParB/RepB/Spo0J family partition protein
MNLTMETTTLITLGQSLHDSPFNPRTTFDPASLQAMAETMKPPHGTVHQPIVVRPVGGEWEIVFGHRRRRAAELAGLAEIPAIVRDMTDEEVKVAQIVENMQREDVSAVEEADGLNVLRRQHGMAVEDLMKRTGKSRSFVYNRLRLATAHDVVRKAVIDKLVTPEAGQEIARVPVMLQPQALESCTYECWSAEADRHVPTGRSYREVKQIIREEFQLELAEAPFDIHSIKLITGKGSCDSCPENSSNEPALCEEIGAGVCTNSACFADKRKAAFEQRIAAARKAGRVVLTGDDAMAVRPHRWDHSLRGYAALSDSAFDEEVGGEEVVKSVTWAAALERMGKKAPKPALLADPHTVDKLTDVISVADQAKILKALGVYVERDPTPSTAAQAPRDGGGPWPFRTHVPAEERTPAEKAVQDGLGWKEVRLALFEKLKAAPRTEAELRAVLLMLYGTCDDLGFVETAFGWTEELNDCDDPHEVVRRKLEELNGHELGVALVLYAMDSPAAFVGERDYYLKERLALAEAYGVDVLAVTGQKQSDEAGSAVDAPERDPNTADMFETAGEAQ